MMTETTNKLQKVFRVNTINNSTGLPSIAIAKRIDEISFRCKFANGNVEDMLEDEIKFSNPHSPFKPFYFINVKPWMLN